MQKILLRIRLNANINQSKLARKIGLCRSLISKVEIGSRKPTLELIEKYHEFFNIELSEIFYCATRQTEQEACEALENFLTKKQG
jgi:transcriptional regulator with XRE-family HTH domain